METLVAIGTNPVYAAPQPDMEALWRRAPFTAVLQESADETGRASQWGDPLRRSRTPARGRDAPSFQRGDQGAGG